MKEKECEEGKQGEIIQSPQKKEILFLKLSLSTIKQYKRPKTVRVAARWRIKLRGKWNTQTIFTNQKYVPQNDYLIGV